MDENIFNTRIIFDYNGYSACFITRADMENSELNLDVSVDSPLFRAGRVKKMGVWRELSNPLTAFAGSDIYLENPILDKNYERVGASRYGFSAGQKEGSSFNILFTDYLWIGASLSMKSDYIEMRGFASFTENNKIQDNGWFTEYPVIPGLNIIHLGLQSLVSLEYLKFDFLGLISGNPVFRAGYYTRLFTECKFNKLKIAGVAGLVSPDFISTSVDLTDDKYLLSLSLEIYPLNYMQIEIQSQYREAQLSVIPGVYIPCSGKTLFRTTFDNREYLFSTGLSQNFRFDKDGRMDVDNMFTIRTGLAGVISLFLNLNVSFDFRLIYERVFGAELKCNFPKTDVEFFYRFTEERTENKVQHILRFGIDQRIRVGSIFFKVEFVPGGSAESLSLGYRSVFD